MIILFIDNDKTYSEPTISRLRTAGHVVIFASSVAQALTSIDNDTFNLVILDIMMSRGELSSKDTKDGQRTGIYLLKLLYEKFKKSVPVIILTVLEKQNIAGDIDLYPNVYKYLEKPIFPSGILDEIAELSLNR